MFLLSVISLFSFAGLTIGTTIDPRIVGGMEIPITLAPYQVSLRRIANDNFLFGSGFYCGGSLISNSVVLTAAHCFYDYDGKQLKASDLQVVGGHANLNGRNSNTFVSAVSSFKIHESYKHNVTFDNDIAVIRLSINATINANSTIKLINIPTSSYPVGTSCLISGWGTTYSGSTTPSQMLRGAYVPIHNRTECNRAQYLNGNVKNGMFCAGYFTGGVDACQGDSGGPLVCGTAIYGVTSHGIQCALPQYPGIYTDVYYFREWILKNNSVSNFISVKVLFSAMFIVVSIFSL